MIKKHLIPCSLILALLVLVTVFSYTVPKSKISLKKDKYFAISPIVKTSVFNINQLQFAEENLPLGDKKVSLKMKKILASFAFRNLQTHRLHHKGAEWFPVIEPILATYGIPNDFKYVPLVESGLQSGTSIKGAAGYWQFMPATGRKYGLRINNNVDERNNLKKSTIAACKYLKKLHAIFGNWTLVAAAYNVGDSHMKRQIDKQNQTNYFKLKLNSETSGYVYKLISVKEILENPARNGYSNQHGFIAYQAEDNKWNLVD